MKFGRSAGLIGGTLGIVAAGAAVGLAARNYAIGRAPAQSGEPFDPVPCERSRVVVAGDGVPLSVEETGRVDAPLTVVLVHGYALSMASWQFQRRALAQLDIRLVCYDQRNHGTSGRGPATNSTVDQLGADLGVILDDLGDDAPVVLLGHSMGGMTILALAGEQPERFGRQIVGVGLIATSAGMVSELKLSLPAALASLRRPFIPVVAAGMTRSPALIERGRRLGADIAWLLTRRYAFGSADVDPALVRFAEQMIAATPVDVIGEFLPVIMAHDKRAALPALAQVPVVVVVGTRDRLTPPEHSQAITAALPGATLVEIDGAGHLALIERPEEVNDVLLEFLREWM